MNRLAFAPFERALAFPFRYGGQTISFRRGFVLRKTGSSGTIYSEASPLPGHSTDSLEELAEALRLVSAEALEPSGTRKSFPPSLRFALEGLDAQERPGNLPVRTSALVSGNEPAEMRLQLLRFAAAGYGICKLKLSPRLWESQLQLVDELPALRFRLDANLSFSPPLLDALLARLEKLSLFPRIDYLEEPFPGVWGEPAFRGLPLALAADESAPRAPEALSLLDEPNPPSVFIVKPTVAGGLSSLDGYLSALTRAGKRFVFTSTLETEPGRRALLAYLSRRPHEPCGLSTGHLFRETFLPDRPLWDGFPLPGLDEIAALSRLTWRNCP